MESKQTRKREASNEEVNRSSGKSLHGSTNPNDNIYAQAREKLQLSALPESLPGREKEREEIFDTVKRCIVFGKGDCLCIIL